jgi:hypothetical protein
MDNVKKTPKRCPTPRHTEWQSVVKSLRLQLRFRVVRGDVKGTKCPGVNWATLFLGDINTGTWPYRLGESDETVKYGYGFWPTWTIEWLHCKLQTRPLVKEGAQQKQDRKFLTATFRQEVISGRKVPQEYSIPRHTHWLTVSRKVTSPHLNAQNCDSYVS